MTLVTVAIALFLLGLSHHVGHVACALNGASSGGIACGTGNSAVTCLNGASCERTGETYRCACLFYFFGTSCEKIYLQPSMGIKTPQWNIGPNFIEFSWLRSISIPSGYQFVWYQKYINNPQYVYQNITTNQTVTTVKAEPFISGAVAYVICVIDDVFNRSDAAAWKANTVQTAPNCFSFKTDYDGNDPYTKVALGVLIGMCAILLFLVVLRGIVNCAKRVRDSQLEVGNRKSGATWEWVRHFTDSLKRDNNVTYTQEVDVYAKSRLRREGLQPSNRPSPRPTTHTLHS